MIEELIEELNEFKECKKKLLSLQKDKQIMSDMLFELMTEKYQNTAVEDRKKHFQKDTCRHCRYEGCNVTLSEEIEMPIRSEKGWIPATRSCENFEWS